jgi:hypothetical protein
MPRNTAPTLVPVSASCLKLAEAFDFVRAVGPVPGVDRALTGTPEGMAKAALEASV